MSKHLKLGDIKDRLGLTVDGSFITTVLGIEPAERDKRSMLFTPAQLCEISRAMGTHFTELAEKIEAQNRQEEEDEL